MPIRDFDEGIYLQHITRLASGKPKDLGYASWYDAFKNSLLSCNAWQKMPHGHIDPYAFPMELFDYRLDPQEAALLFIFVDAERYARWLEAEVTHE